MGGGGGGGGTTKIQQLDSRISRGAVGQTSGAGDHQISDVLMEITYFVWGSYACW